MTELRYVDIPYIENETKTKFKEKFESLFDTTKKMSYVSWMGKVSKFHSGREKEYDGCFAPSEALNVLHDGRVVACCYDVYGEMELGNLSSQNLKQIQNGKKIKELSKRLKNREIEGLPCEYCEKPWK